MEFHRASFGYRVGMLGPRTGAKKWAPISGCPPSFGVLGEYVCDQFFVLALVDKSPHIANCSSDEW